MNIDPYNTSISLTGSAFKATSDRTSAVSRDRHPFSSEINHPLSFQDVLKTVANSQPFSSKCLPNDKSHPLTEAQRFALSRQIKLQLTENILKAFSDEETEVGDPLPFTENIYGLFPYPADETPMVSTIRQMPSETPSAASGDFDDIILEAAAAYDVDPDLIRGVVKAESDFDPRAQSPKGAMGLMQLMPQTAEELGVKDPYDPTANIMGGTRYLKRLIDRYQGDVSLALAAYNWGMGNLENHGDRLPSETRNYVRKITAFYQEQKTTSV